MSGTVTDPLDQLEQEYSPEERRPLRWYAVLVGTNVAIAAGAVAHASRTGRLPERLPVGDLLLGAVATYKASRLVTRSSVASPLRAPFTRYAGVAGPAELEEEVRGEGLRHAIGELLTCPYCMGHWMATAYGLGLVYAPQPTRFVAGVLAMEAGAEQLQTRAG
jgi:hypothetical protein